MKTKILMLGMVLSLMTISCSKDKATDSSNNMTAAEAISNAKIDSATDDVAGIVQDQEANTYTNSVTGKTEEVNTTYPVITRVPDFGTPPTVGQTVTKTIDFGTNYTLPNGNVISGIITISFVYNPGATSHTITYSFTNFYHNTTKLEGNKTFTRTMTVATATSPSHPIVTMDMNITATFANGDVYTRTGTRTREITAGYDTPNVLNDDIYQVTGNWNTTFPNGVIRYTTITSPLVLKLATGCSHHFVQGIISFAQNNHTATLDYGNGDCDNLAIFTKDGISYTIVLGN